MSAQVSCNEHLLEVLLGPGKGAYSHSVCGRKPRSLQLLVGTVSGKFLSSGKLQQLSTSYIICHITGLFRNSSKRHTLESFGNCPDVAIFCQSKPLHRVREPTVSGFESSFQISLKRPRNIFRNETLRSSAAWVKVAVD